LYRLAISVCPRLDSYIKAERWFLSSSKPFDRDTRAIPLFSDTKLQQPTFFFRMGPLDLAMKIRRTSTLISAIRPMKTETDLSCMLLNNTPNASLPLLAWRQLREAFFNLVPLLDIPRGRVNKLRMLDRKGKFSIVSQKDFDKIDPPHPLTGWCFHVVKRKASLLSSIKILIFIAQGCLPHDSSKCLEMSHLT